METCRFSPINVPLVRCGRFGSHAIVKCPIEMIGTTKILGCVPRIPRLLVAIVQTIRITGVPGIVGGWCWRWSPRARCDHLRFVRAFLVRFPRHRCAAGCFGIMTSLPSFDLSSTWLIAVTILYAPALIDVPVYVKFPRIHCHWRFNCRRRRRLWRG